MNKLSTFYNLIHKYHPIDWLTKCIELERKHDGNKKDRLSTYSKTEFLVIMADITLRISQNETMISRLPVNQDYLDFINLYINTQGSMQHELIKKHGIISLSLIMAEQVKWKYPSVNLIGRLLLLYPHYEDEIIQETGLDISHIIAILLLINAYYSDEKKYAFEANDMIHEFFEPFHSNNITKFLNYFSIDIKGYRVKLKELGFDKHQLYSFRLLERYPIIKFNENRYIVPSLDNLLHSMSHNMYIHLLTHFAQKNQGKIYQDSLGSHFENYVRLLTSKVFSNISEAKDLVPKDSKNAEFVISHLDTAIVVEVKKFILHRDSPFKNDINDLDTLLERHIKKAFKQIETTFKHVQEPNKIGLIVTFGDINMSTSICSYLKQNHADSEIEYLDNIIILSIGSYEALMANSPNDILEILTTYLQIDPNNKGDIILTLDALDKERINPFLLECYDQAIDEINFEKLKQPEGKV